MIIKIGTDRFWVRASNIERWADILECLPEKISCRSKKDIAKDLLNYKTDEDGRIVNADEVYGLFGIEKSKASMTIVGSNFIRETSDGYELSDNAVELVKKYKYSDDWEKVLGEQLLKYSLRVRAIALPLLNGGHLYFEKGYMENLKSAYIDYCDIKYHVFTNKNDEININRLIELYPEKVLGPFWKEELCLEDGDNVEINGVNKKEPSLGSNSYLKIPMILFKYLEWIKEENDGSYVFNKHKIREDIHESTYDSLIMEEVRDDLEILQCAISDNLDARGFFPLEKVGIEFKKKMNDDEMKNNDQWIDSYFTKAVNLGRIEIIDHEQGLPIHGRGLFGKKDYQLIKLKINF